MGFGFGGCGSGRCDCCVGGYGDGPCGGYYSYWDKCRCGPFGNFNRGCGCSPFGSFGKGCGCGFPYFGFNNCWCSPGWRNPRCGMFFNIPVGGCNMGFFLPF